MRKSLRKRGIAAVTAMVLLLSLASPCTAMADVSEDGEVISHGTADKWITKDMVNNTPPKEYTINSKTQGEAKDGRYGAYFLDTEIQTVQIEIDDNNLNYLLQNALDEPYVMADSVTIGDATVEYCGLKTGEADTLEHAVKDNPGSDRFSFTVNFGKYIKKKEYGETQNFFGVTEISFNNFFFDKSMMKEFFALKLMDEMGLPTPEYGLAKLYINGNYYGLYAMIEALDEPILDRYYGDGRELSSYLCKPEGTKFLYNELMGDASPLWENDEDTKKDVEDMLPTVMLWANKLNCLSNGRDFEANIIDVNSERYLELLSEVMDVDEVVRYFAVHSWLCQMDNMFMGQKNFGLYIDPEGKALVLPWDYDLAFGCYYPCNAQNTANYPVDIMYSLDYSEDDREAKSAEVYAEFPLFHVIYQCEALMEKYHTYMEECSKVATLGGTVAATGKSYEPGYFYSFVETMGESIIEAATEELAENVYYMNGIRQPRDVKKALPNITKIIALRSVGVWTQVNGMETTISAEGCNLETLGNAIPGASTNAGVLTVVDDATGIFATSEYSGGRGVKAPMLTLKPLDSSHALYSEILQALGCTEDKIVRAYAGTNNQDPISAYSLTIPLTTEEMKWKEELNFYIYSKENGIKKLSVETADNLVFGEAESIDGIIVLHGEAVLEPTKVPEVSQMPEEPVQEPGEETEGGAVLLVGGIISLIAVIGIGAVLLKKKMSGV